MFANCRFRLPAAVFAALCATSQPAAAAVIRVDVTVDDITFTDTPSAFSFPHITFTNLSDPGYLISDVAIANGFIDWVADGSIIAPAGGTATPTGGTQVSAGNPDDGCSPVSFSLGSFDASDSFAFQVDPESDACTSVVYDWRLRLDPDQVAASAGFTGPGTSGIQTLSGNDWVKELIDPQGADVFTNQRYRLVLTAEIGESTAVPEPGTLALLGAGLMGLVATRRKRVLF